MNKIIIAIDGYSACGKSTTARAVAAKLAYTYVDSGAMYRAVTYHLLQNNISLTDVGEISEALANVKVSFKGDHNGNPITYLNGHPVEEQIRKMEVSEKVSVVAANSEVRRAMVRIQHLLGVNKGIVMDGRDIGTVVFPEAELKIFMTAELDIRAERRLKELLVNGIEASLDEVRANVTERDHKDTTRQDSPLKKADDAIVVDNSFMTFDEQVDEIIALAEKRINA
jgi:cytidylate kinase